MNKIPGIFHGEKSRFNFVSRRVFAPSFSSSRINFDRVVAIRGRGSAFTPCMPCIPLHCMCQHLHITLFSLILSFHLSLIPLNRFHLGDVNFCLEQIQMPIRHTYCNSPSCGRFVDKPRIFVRVERYYRNNIDDSSRRQNMQ